MQHYEHCIRIFLVRFPHCRAEKYLEIQERRLSKIERRRSCEDQSFYFQLFVFDIRFWQSAQYP